MSSSSGSQQTILFLAANPKDQGRQRLNQELRDVAEGLQRAQRREWFQLKPCFAVRPRDIQRAMLDENPQIVHFSGSGEGESGLVFEDEQGNTRLVTGEALAGLFSLFADKLQCVVLNGCYSQAQAQAIAQHIPYVIGMSQAISEAARIAFAVGFYDALGAGREVEFAYNSGCVAIGLENLPENTIPILCRGASVAMSKTIRSFALPRNPNSPHPFIAGPPISEPRRFFGRQRELKRLFNLLQSQPLQNAAIIGARRSGKTSLLNYLRQITATPPNQLRPGQRTDWLPEPEAYRWIFVDFQDRRRGHQQDLLRYWLTSMQLSIPEPCDLERFMDCVSGNLHRPTVILMDEIGAGLQQCPELDDSFWESLRSLATNYVDGNLAFVLATPEHPMELAHHTGHSSPFFNILGYTTRLGALTEPEARELIASSPIPFAEADIAWILAQSQCHPCLIQILCRERLQGLEDGDFSDDWKTEGLVQIQPFIHLRTSTNL